MDPQIIQMNKDAWRIEDGGVRFFLLAGTKKALLIDSGMTTENAGEIARSLTDLPVSLLNTHADIDHIGGNGCFSSFYMHPGDGPQYERSGKGGRLIPLHDGQEIDLGERLLRIIHLPGHTPGSVAVLDVSRRVLISGDPVQRNGHVFMFGAHRNMDDYIRSLQKLLDQSDLYDEIWPSHADLPLGPEDVKKLLNGAQAVADGRVPGKPVSFHGQGITAFDLGFATLLCDPRP